MPCTGTSLTITDELLDKAEVCYGQQKNQEAITLCRQALRITSVSNGRHNALLFKLYLNLSTNYIVQKRSDSTIYYFSLSNDLLKKDPSLTSQIPNYVCLHWGNQGGFYAEKNNLKQATFYIAHALSIVEKYHLEESYYQLPLLNTLANTYSWMQDYEKANVIFKQIIRKGIAKNNQGFYCISSIIWNCIHRKKYKEARYYLTKGLDLYSYLSKNHLVTNSSEQLQILYYLWGMITFLNKNYLESNRWLDKNINLCQRNKLTKNRILSVSLLQKAQNYYALNRISTALYWVQQGIIANVIEFNDSRSDYNPTLSQTIISDETLFDLLTFKSQLFATLYQQTKQKEYLEKSVRIYLLTTTLAENFRRLVQQQEDKLFFSQKNSVVFNNAINLAFLWYQDEPNTEKANILLRIIEGTKAVTLTEKMALNKIPIPPRAMALKDEEDKELAINSVLKQQISTGELTSFKRDSIRDKLVISELNLHHLSNKLSLQIPQRGSIHGIANISIEEIQANLAKHTALISYTLQEDKILIFVFTKEQYLIKCVYLKHNQLTNYITQLEKALQHNPTVFAYRGKVYAKALYSLLISPIHFMLKEVNSLVICRDGVLNYIPFEVLDTGEEKKNYLLNHYAVSYQFTVLNYLLAQDVKNNIHIKMATFAPFVKQELSTDGTTFSALSEGEIKEGDFYLGSRASKSAFIRKYSNYNVLHLLTHALGYRAGIDKSAVVFHPSDTLSWKLGFQEIIVLALQHCRLLMLEACKTSDGKLENQEGVMSLCYAFFKAGCHAVLAAQWQSHDRASDYITSRFYRYLQEGQSKDFALQRAKLDFISSDLGIELDHPFYWANLTITGNVSPIYHTEWNKKNVLYILICVLLLLIWVKYKPIKF